jgi:hypothetical protein
VVGLTGIPNVQVRLLFHHGEVGSLSNTGKLLLITNTAYGYIDGLRWGDLEVEEWGTLGMYVEGFFN